MTQIRLSPAEAKRLGLEQGKRGAGSKKREGGMKQARVRRPVGWETCRWVRDGRGLRCVGCAMWLPLWAWPDYGHGPWPEALGPPPPPEGVP